MSAEQTKKRPTSLEIGLLNMVPRRGLEPPRSYPLVPETSASTNSATWAMSTLAASDVTKEVLVCKQERNSSIKRIKQFQ
jgi:hypothetical protein